MVYDGTKCGLNDQLWALWFALPTVEDHLYAVVPGTYIADLDVGEQFLDFMLHPKIQPYAGVDLTPFFPWDEDTLTSCCCRWEKWICCYMGCCT